MIEKSLATIDFNKAADIKPGELREMIAKFEKSLENLPKSEIPLKHYFSKDVYAREIFIPKGTILVGKIHKKQNLNILSQGEVSVMSVDGVIRAKAPFTIVASPGVKRVIYAHEDATWTTIHGSPETDLDKLESEFIAKDYEDVYLSSPRTFHDAISVLGFTADELKTISENEFDQKPFPETMDFISVEPSPIHGKGLFAHGLFLPNQLIAKARNGTFRTPAGRFTNHSGDPNAKMVLVDNCDVELVAIKEIDGRTTPVEITTDYYFNFTNTRGVSCHG